MVGPSSLLVCRSVIRLDTHWSEHRRTIGQTILASGMVDDTVAWTLLSNVLGIAAADQVAARTLLFAGTRILLFLVVAFTLGRWIIQRALNFTQDRIESPERILTLVIDELVRMSPCNVMIARGEVEEQTWEPTRILVPTNGTVAAR